MPKAVVPLTRLLLAGLGLGAGVLLLSLLMRPNMPVADSSDIEAIKAVEPEFYEAREQNGPGMPDSATTDSAFSFTVDVDYSEGKSAPWYPKGESPILADLVAEGKLPPVEERVGPEPLVLRGVDGVGRYGGTLHHFATSRQDCFGMAGRVTRGLVCWSPNGYPIVPGLAKSVRHNEDYTAYTFELRRGVKWSDGHPYTAEDVMYWWNYEANNKAIRSWPPSYMEVAGRQGTVKKINDYTVRFEFPVPNPTFLELLAAGGDSVTSSAPSHYCSRFHPEIGDPELISELMALHNCPSPRRLYAFMKKVQNNPEIPQLSPWIARLHRPTGVQVFVRNPYYYAVDEQGNQLPYVDRLAGQPKSAGGIPISVAQGGASIQRRSIGFKDYTLLMSNREAFGYHVYHWRSGAPGPYVIYPNLNRAVDPDVPETKHKHDLLNNKYFRRALSLAIDRDAIIEMEYGGVTEPANAAPRKGSPYYSEKTLKMYTQYDQEEANRLLDEIGLTQRDSDGLRTFSDGSRMTWYLTYTKGTEGAVPELIAAYWRSVGVRLLLKPRSSRLLYVEFAAGSTDFVAEGRSTDEVMFPEVRCAVVPYGWVCYWAPGYARWNLMGGLYGNARVQMGSAYIEPPPGSPIRQVIEMYERFKASSDTEVKRDLMRDIFRTASEEMWIINISTPPPVPVVVKKGLRNVPRDVLISQAAYPPRNSGMDTYYFEDPVRSSALDEAIKEEISGPTPQKDETEASIGGEVSGNRLGSIISGSFLLVFVGLLVLAGFKRPFILRRLLLLIPMLFIVSIIAFVVIHLPPGSFIESKIAMNKAVGDPVAMRDVEELKEMFHLEEPMVARYARWVGFYWFAGFKSEDKGLLQGDLGISMEHMQPVNKLVGDRILMTMLISLGTILFTWILAIPIGIYSAVRQYSLGDYLFTFLGFIGMCIPGFLLALLLMYAAQAWFGMSVSGLFSERYAAQPYWDWPKIADLLRHIWFPIVVMGVGGAAGMIRVMRANLLDELKKPYVTTARAKGVRPVKLLFKYPVRLALNPFISGLGGYFPMLVSGSAIVGIVMSLPTVGPLMLEALMSEDMIMAGSLLVVLSLVGMLGTIVSDLLLLLVDPRIRFEGGSK